MTTPSPIEYVDAPPQVRAVYDDIKKTRNVADVNNFWKYLARDPATLKRTWESVKQIMAPGALDPLVKEMIYLAVSVTNGCPYCIASHSFAARKAGMSEAMFGEVMAVVGMANETRGFFHVRSSSADQVDQLSDVEIEQLVKAADIVTMARTAVDRS